MSSSASTTGTKTGRARRRFGQLWQAPVFLLGLLSFIGVAASAPWRQSPHKLAFDQQLSVLRKALETDTDPDAMVQLAEAVLLKLPTYRWRVAEVQFLAGSAYYRQASKKPAAVAKEIWPRAVEQLEQALASNPPDLDRPALQYRLGYSLFKLGKDWPRAVDLMTQSVEKGAEEPLQGYLALAEANQKLVRPNTEAALYALRRVIDLTPEQQFNEVAEARINYAELLIRAERRTEAIKELEKVSMRTKRDVRLKAKLMQANACMEEKTMAYLAVPIWLELLHDAGHIEGGRAYIQYQLGWAYNKMSPPINKECKEAWTNALLLGGPAGQAAGLRMGELRLNENPIVNAADAIKDWRKALEAVERPETFKNPYIDAAQVADMLENALKLVQVDPEKWQAIAELMRKVTKGSNAEAEFARATEFRAKEMNRKRPGNGITVEQVQAQYRRAAEAYQSAAKLASAGNRTPLLWSCIKCYLEAKETTVAQRLLLQQYLPEEKGELNLAEGWFTLGDIYLGEGKKEDAREALVKCLQYNETPYAFKANYLLAAMEMDKKNYEQAHVILARILGSGNPDIDRAAHEKSMYRMGDLLVKMEKFREAETYLKNAITLYPDNPLVLATRLQLGECYRRLAGKEAINEQETRKKITPNTPDDVKAALEETLRAQRTAKMTWLNDAIKTYLALKDQLEAQGRAQPLDAHTQMILRRARFCIGECHREGEEFDLAIPAFAEVQAKHPKTVEGLYASARICWCVKVMQGSADVRVKHKLQASESLRALLADLKEMPENHEVFRAPNPLNRDAWAQWAQSTQRELFEPQKGLPPRAFP